MAAGPGSNGHGGAPPYALPSVDDLPDPFSVEPQYGGGNGQMGPALPALPAAPVAPESIDFGPAALAPRAGESLAPVDPGVPLAPWAGAQGPVYPPGQPWGVGGRQLAYGPRTAIGVDPPAGAAPSHMLGLSTLLVAAGAGIGCYYAGAFGCLAGSLMGGAAVNAWRAIMYYRQGTPEGDGEAKVSGAYALLAAAGGGYVAYKFAHQRLASNPDEPPDEPPEQTSSAGGCGCGVRRVGP